MSGVFSFVSWRSCWKKSEPILRRTPTNEDAPPPPRGLGGHQRKMFLAFRICTRPIFSKNGKDIFLWGSALQVFGQVAGRQSYPLGHGGIPPTPSRFSHTGCGGSQQKMERKFLVLLRRFRLLKEQSYFNIFACSFLRPRGETRRF